MNTGLTLLHTGHVMLLFVSVSTCIQAKSRRNQGSQTVC